MALSEFENLLALSFGYLDFFLKNFPFLGKKILNEDVYLPFFKIIWRQPILIGTCLKSERSARFDAVDYVHIFLFLPIWR